MVGSLLYLFSPSFSLYFWSKFILGIILVLEWDRDHTLDSMSRSSFCAFYILIRRSCGRLVCRSVIDSKESIDSSNQILFLFGVDSYSNVMFQGLVGSFNRWHSLSVVIIYSIVRWLYLSISLDFLWYLISSTFFCLV